MTDCLWVLERCYVSGLSHDSNRDSTGTGVERNRMTCSQGRYRTASQRSRTSVTENKYLVITR